MSSAEDSGDSSMQRKLEDFLSCPICFEGYSTPKTLPCLHTFCLQCLQDHEAKSAVRAPADNSARTQIACPVCREALVVPSGGLAEIKTNFFVESLCAEFTAVVDSAEVAQSAAAAARRQQPGCDNCEKPASAISHCDHCEEHLCGDCTTVHKAHKLTRGHQLKLLEQLKAAAAHHDSNKEKELCFGEASNVCKVHLDNYKLLCSDCGGWQPLCIQCFLEAHNGHRVTDLVSLAAEARTALQAELGELTESLDRDQGRLEAAEQAQAALMSRHQQAVDTVTERHTRLTEALENYSSALISGTTELLNSGMKELQADTEQLAVKVACQRSVLDYGHAFMKHASDSYMVSGQKKVEDRLEYLRNTLSKDMNTSTLVVSNFDTVQFLVEDYTLDDAPLSKRFGLNLPGFCTADQQDTESRTFANAAVNTVAGELRSSQGTQTQTVQTKDKAVMCDLPIITAGATKKNGKCFSCEYEFLESVKCESLTQGRKTFTKAIHDPCRNKIVQHVLKRAPKPNDEVTTGARVHYLCVLDDIAVRLVKGQRHNGNVYFNLGMHFKLFHPHIQDRVQLQTVEEEVTYSPLHTQDQEFKFVEQYMLSSLRGTLEHVRRNHPLSSL